MSREKIVEESLGSEDKIQKSYGGRLDGVYGILSMSNRKLLFITEKGIFRKSYSLVLDLPYEEIDSLRTEGDYNLIIEGQSDETKDSVGLDHTFMSDTLISKVEEVLRELMKEEPSQDI